MGERLQDDMDADLRYQDRHLVITGYRGRDEEERNEASERHSMTTAEEQPDLVSIIITDGHRAVQDPRRPHRQANLTFGVAMQPDQYETVYSAAVDPRLLPDYGWDKVP